MTGRRKGNRRADKRWIDEHGNEWDSRFEYNVYSAQTDLGYNIRRCDERDAISYGTPVKGGRCMDCGMQRVLQERTYTADLYVLGGQSLNKGRGYLLELKGYWPAPKRNLFRYIAQQCGNEGIDLRIAFESGRAMRGTKLTGPEYIRKYCKNVMAGVFNKKTGEIDWHD